MASAPPLLLYSTNTWFKYTLQRHYRNDIHFVWCSPAFDPTTLAARDPRSLGAASSNPCGIYRELLRDVISGGGDLHSAKIQSQKASFRRLVKMWEKDGSLTTQQAKDIIVWLKRAQLRDWRPLIYVIPYAGVAGRVEEVPMQKRASFAPEYVIRDLGPHEFEVVEP